MATCGPSCCRPSSWPLSARCSAAIVAFPLAFFAARNITPSGSPTRCSSASSTFMRSVDMLIWALFFTRAFGPGPLAGSAAIFFTETGTLGKTLFRSSREHRRQASARGSSRSAPRRLLVQRYGVLPAGLPGLHQPDALPMGIEHPLGDHHRRGRRRRHRPEALGGDATNTNWANVFYMVLLILIVVFVFDKISNRLRRRLVGDMPT